MVKEMLTVLMDGIKDAEMLIDYADKAKRMEDDTYQWFLDHAKYRVGQLVTDYNRIDSEVNLTQKADEGDALAEAMQCHLKEEIERLRNKLNQG